MRVRVVHAALVVLEGSHKRRNISHYSRVVVARGEVVVGNAPPFVRGGGHRLQMPVPTMGEPF